VKLKYFPDQQLIGRIRKNDRTVLAEIFTRYERLVIGYVRSHGGDETDAEDMLQEAIIVVWQRVCSGDFELTSKLGTYLLGIVKNKWSAELRKRSRIVEETTDGSRDGNPSVLETIIRDEKREMVRKALDKLQPVCRELLLLFYFEGRNFQDIARVMGFAGADVAKSKKYQCKKALEAILREQQSEVERSM